MLLHVHLLEAYKELILPSKLFQVADLLEDHLHRSLQESFRSWCRTTFYSEGLPRTCLSVGKDTHVKAVYQRLNELRDLGEDRLLTALLIEDLLEVKPVFPLYVL